MKNHTNLESRLEVDYELKLDEPNKGKKKSILETLHTKSEQEQADEMIKFWKKQMEKVNASSHKVKRIKMGEFNLKYTNSCKLEETPIMKEKNTLEFLVGKTIDLPINLNPIQLNVRDCFEGENDARKWFVSTMHLYIKFLVDQDSIKEVIEKHHQNTFLGSLYDVYISKDSNEKDLSDKTSLNMIRDDCFDIHGEDVIDEFSKEIFTKSIFINYNYFYLFNNLFSYT